MFFQFLINGLITGLLIALSSFAFSLVYNTTRVFHMAFSAIYLVAAYIFYSVYVSLQFPLILSLVIAAAGTSGLSVLIEVVIYRPLTLKKASSNVMLISSIGVMIMTINIVSIIYGSETKVIQTNISDLILIANISLTHSQLLQGTISAIALAILIIALAKSKLGLTIRSIRDDQMLASIFGVNVARYRVAIFALSGSVAALAACLTVYDTGMDPYIGMPILLNAIVALIIGGIGRFESPLLGGLILGLTQSVSAYFFEARWENAITFAVLILFLIFRPNGIMGELRREV